MTQKVNYSDTTPAADTNNQLLKWKADAPSSDPTITRNISVETPLLTASGAGHQAGIAPDPGAAAGTTKFLREDAAWTAPPAMVASGVGHQAGLVPDPGATAGATKFLREDAAWAVPAGGGSGSDDFIPGVITFPPAIASFTWVNQGTGSVAATGTKGALFMSSGIVASTPNVKLLTQALPATPYQFIVGILPLVPNNGSNHPQCGIALYDSVSGKLTNIGYDPQAGGIELDKWTSTTVFSATYTIARAVLYQHFFRSLVWLRLADDGTTRTYSVSSDGTNWLTIFSVGRTDFLTPNQAALYIQPDQLVFASAMTIMSYYLGT